MSIVKKYREQPLVRKLLGGMLIGVLLGAFIGPPVTVIEPLGTVFLNLLRMAALPLVIVNLISGISSLDDPRIFGRIGIKIMVYYTVTTAIAIILGMITGLIVRPGAGFVLEGSYDATIQSVPTFLNTIVGLLPSNIFAALTEGRFDQVVVFSAFIGVATLLLPKEEKNYLNQMVNSLAKLFNKVISIIMGYAPIGIMALMASTVGRYGRSLAGAVAQYVGAMYIAILVQIVVYLILLFIFVRMSPLHFLKKASPIIITAMGTTSSLASVPVNLNCADDLGVSRSISSFTIPLGAQVNRDGNGIMLAISFLFAAQAINAPLPLGTLVSATLIALLLTFGSGGVPGSGVVTIAIIIDAFGLPLEIVGIVSGFVVLYDMGVTTLNVLGDLAGTVIVANSEKKLALAKEAN